MLNSNGFESYPLIWSIAIYVLDPNKMMIHMQHKYNYKEEWGLFNNKKKIED